MKIAILIPYFKRPNLIRNALKSILVANHYHQDWELLFHDDGSPVPGEPIVREILKDHLHKVKFHRTEYSSVEDKKSKGGILGDGLNYLMRQSKADVIITLCDDDAIYPNYFSNLRRYFTDNPNVVMCYSHVVLWEPTKETVHEAMLRNDMKNQFNEWTGPIDSNSRHDWSQVAWRLPEAKKQRIWYYSPMEKNHDAYIFDLLNKRFGLTQFSGFVGQFKAWWPKQQTNVQWHNAIQDEVNIDV